MPRAAAELAEELNRHRRAFKAFLAARVGSEADAEDILQDGLAKALRRADGIHDEARLTAWFYQLLRRAVVDHYRARGSAHRRHEALGGMLAALGEDVAAAPAGWNAHVCTCLAGVVTTLRPMQADLLRRVDLDGEPVRAAARALGISANSASVTLHRARAELRRRLEVLCGDCTESACLECDCAERAGRA